MDFLKNQFERIRAQLGGLSASQKMLTAALVVIMVMTLSYWVRYAGKPEMETLLDQQMNGDRIVKIREALGKAGIPNDISDGKVMVPGDRKLEALSALSEDQVLPPDTSGTFDAIIKQMNPFSSESQNAHWWAEMKQAKLAEVIRGWKDVADANVIIDATEHRSFTNPTKPSATINIRMRDGKRPEKKLVQAAGDLVAGAQAGLDKGRITVVVNGVSYPMHDANTDSGPSGEDLIEVRQGYEEQFTQKIVKQLGWMHSDVFVSVTVDVNTKSTQQVQTTYDPKGTAKVPTREQTKTIESSSSPNTGGEPGTGANTSASVADSRGGEGTTQNQNEDTTEYQVGMGSSVTTIREGPGAATVKAATVRVPYSYFVKAYKAVRPGAKDPDDATMQPVLQLELAKIRNEVKNCTGLTDDKTVAVETYADAVLTSDESVPVVQQTTVVAMVGGHGKEIALGLLAAVSLVMMSMMVRKSTPVTVAVHNDVKGGGGPAMLMGGEAVAGEAGEGEQALDGMELDEDAAKTQQMLGQVSDLVKENPDAAATLIKRWLNK